MEPSAPKPRNRILKWILWFAGGAALVFALCFVLAFADALGLFHDPPLWLEQNGSKLTAHIERLGEYVSPVGRIQIQESDSGKVIYECVAKHEPSAVLNFKLQKGMNPVNLLGNESESYVVIEPHGEETYSLRDGITYRVTVWGDKWTFRRAKFVF